VAIRLGFAMILVNVIDSRACLLLQGYQGMVDGEENFVAADWKCVSGIIHLVRLSL